MGKPEEKGYGQDAGSLRPIDELLKRPHDTNLYPNLIEDYYNLAEKDIHLAEIYRLAATSQDERFVPNPVQTARIDGELWVDVLAEMEAKSDPGQLHEIMQVHTYTRRYVSGRVLIQRLPELSRIVKRLQTARPIHATLDTSVKSIKADSGSLTQLGSSIPTGKNVIIGIIDDGCDYLHPNFLDEEGSSRILYLWDQNGTPKTPSLPYGREYDQTTLTQMIQDNVDYKSKPDPYEGLDYQPEAYAHGTHVMDIAAGNGKSTGFPGIAPEADLIFVHLSLPTTTEAEEEFLGSSIRLYEAVKYIFDKAELEDKPAVVNISLATNGGPHDGTSLLEKMFDDLLEDEDGGRAIVIAAGNSNEDGVHTRDSIDSSGKDFHWSIKQRASTDNPESWVQRHEMEIWYESQDSLNLDIYYPKKKSDNPDDPDVEIEKLGTSKRGNTLQEPAAKEPDDGFDKPFILIHHSFDEAANENHINIFIDDRFTGLKEGKIYDYRFQLTPSPTSQAVEYHAWIERNNDYPSRFADDKKEFTINSIGNAKLPIVVGAYDNEEAAKPILKSSGSGPSRNSDALDKPDISAPGVNIFAAGARHYDSEDGKVLPGTSQAAPHVSGVIALMFATTRDLNISQIRQILKDTADRDPPDDTPATKHNPQYGFGRINCLEALKKVLA